MHNIDSLRLRLRRLQDFRVAANEELQEGEGSLIDLSQEIRQLDDAITQLHVQIWHETGKIKRLAGERQRIQCPHCKRWYWVRRGEVLPASDQRSSEQSQSRAEN